MSTLGSATTSMGRPKCLIACSGSVATLKIPELVADLSLHFDVMIICTNSAGFFLERSSLYNEDAWRRFELVGGWNLVLKDEDEWQMWNTIGRVSGISNNFDRHILTIAFYVLLFNIRKFRATY